MGVVGVVRCIVAGTSESFVAMGRVVSFQAALCPDVPVEPRLGVLAAIFHSGGQVAITYSISSSVDIYGKSCQV